tara:strand:- start:998 stop:2071 length:1074 start_codon:yes stop_codon:yes gene_type:complete
MTPFRNENKWWERNEKKEKGWWERNEKKENEKNKDVRLNNSQLVFQEMNWGSNIPQVNSKNNLPLSPRVVPEVDRERNKKKERKDKNKEFTTTRATARRNTKNKETTDLINLLFAAVKQRENASKLIGSASRRRLSKLQKWIASQRKFILGNSTMFNIRLWTFKSTSPRSRRLLPVLYAAPRTPRNIQGFLYRKVVLRNGNELNLKFHRATSWSLNPLFAASFKLSLSSPNERHILLRLPLNTPAPKLYIGDTSPLLNYEKSALSKIKPNISPEAEVILAPVDLEVVQRRSKPLGHITGISKTGESRKRLSTKASELLYGFVENNRRPQRVSKGIEAQEVDIEVVDVREKAGESYRL